MYVNFISLYDNVPLVGAGEDVVVCVREREGGV